MSRTCRDSNYCNHASTAAITVDCGERGFWARFARIFFPLFSVIIPLKFSSIMLPEIPGMWQEDAIGWLINPWPYGFFFIISAIALIINWIALPQPKHDKNHWDSVFSGLFILLWLSAMLGLYNASQYATGFLILEYLLGLINYLLAVKLFLSVPGNRIRLISGWGIGIVLMFLNAIYQYFIGFAVLEEYIRDTGQQVSTVLLAKIADRRTSAPYDLSNSLAGAILLGTPVLLIFAGKMAKYFTPEKISRNIFTTLVYVAAIFIFVTTRSRAAILALLAAIALTAILKIKNLKLKIGAVVLIALIISGGGLYIANSKRGLGSMQVRLDYAATSAKMAFAHPFAGGGWGNFQFDYMLTKNDGTEEAPRDPHNMILSFASQCGIISGLLIVALMIIPFYGCWRLNGFKKRENQLIAFGLMAFSIHALAEIHLLIPSLMAMWLTAGMLLLIPEESSTADIHGRNPLLLIPAIAGIVLFSYGLYADYCFQQVTNASAMNRDMRHNFNKLDKLRPYSPYHHLLIARRLTPLSPVEAGSFARVAAERSPRDPEPYIILLENAIAIHDTTAAQNALDEARKRFPHNWLFDGTPEEALEQIKKSRL